MKGQSLRPISVGVGAALVVAAGLSLSLLADESRRLAAATIALVTALCVMVVGVRVGERLAAAGLTTFFLVVALWNLDAMGRQPSVWLTVVGGLVASIGIAIFVKRSGSMLRNAQKESADALLAHERSPHSDEK